MNKKKIDEKISQNRAQYIQYTIGYWAFIAGIVLIGFMMFQDAQYFSWMLKSIFALGIIIGLFNITKTEIKYFLKAGVSLILVSFLGYYMGVMSFIHPALQSMLYGIVALCVPAVIIVALKEVWIFAKDR